MSLKSWKLLESNFQKNAQKKITDYFSEDADRVKKLSLQWESFYVDYSKNLLDQETLDLLVAVAEESGLNQAIKAYFEGKKINETEDRAVLHTALRQLNPSSIIVDGENITPKIEEVKKQMYDFADRVISGDWKGHTGKVITHVVNIGIGGSDLGPAMVTEALEFYSNQLRLTFVSNVEGDHVGELIKKIDPETTLFVIVSKSFTTQETISNANTIRKCTCVCHQPTFCCCFYQLGKGNQIWNYSRKYLPNE